MPSAPVKPLEDLPSLVRRDARAVIPDQDLVGAVLRRALDVEAPSLGGVLPGVVHHVQQGLDEGSSIQPRLWGFPVLSFTRQVQCKLHAIPLRHRLEKLCRLPYHLAHGLGPHVVGPLAAFHAAQVQDVLDQHGEASRLAG